MIFRSYRNIVSLVDIKIACSTCFFLHFNSEKSTEEWMENHSRIRRASENQIQLLFSFQFSFSTWKGVHIRLLCFNKCYTRKAIQQWRLNTRNEKWKFSSFNSRIYKKYKNCVLCYYMMRRREKTFSFWIFFKYTQKISCTRFFPTHKFCVLYTQKKITLMQIEFTIQSEKKKKNIPMTFSSVYFYICSLVRLKVISLKSKETINKIG